MNVTVSLLCQTLTLCCALVASSAIAQGGKVEVIWLNQAAFKITTPGGKVIITDPWLLPHPGYMTPLTPPEYRNLEALGKVDVLLVTHAHGDHILDAPAIAKMHNIRLWGQATSTWRSTPWAYCLPRSCRASA